MLGKVLSHSGSVWIKRHGSALGYLFAGFLAVALRWPTMNFPLTEAHAFRQMQTTLMIREFMDGGFFQLSPLPVFGPPWQVPMEFPLFQWMAAIGGSVVGASPQIAGRLTALFFFLVCAALVALIGNRLYSKSAGFIGFVVFLFLPFGWQWGNAPLIEFAATAGALGSFYLVMLWVERRSWWLIAALTITLSIVCLVKITTAVAWIIPLIVIAVFWKRTVGMRELTSRWPLLIPAVFSALAGLGWTRFSDVYKSDRQFTQFLASQSMTEWNFGSVEQRLDTLGWSMIFGYSEAIVGLLVIFFLLLISALIFWGNRATTIGLASTLFIGPMIFFNLYYMHGYYLAAIYPALVIIMAAGIVGVAKAVRTDPLKSNSARWSVIATATFGLIVMAWISPEGQLVSQRSSEGLYQFPLAQEIVDNTPVDAGVITVGCDWNPAYSYLSGRKTLMLSGRNPDESIPSDWIGSELQFVASCIEGIDPAVATGLQGPFLQVSPNIWKIFS
jgi:4-amino-4-deoxy-L-arabinose transferase-like glycosyltransferase